MTLLGAGKVFSSEDSTVTDKDIEDILDKREKTTTQPKAKIQKIAKDSIKFSWNKRMCLYTCSSPLSFVHLPNTFFYVDNCYWDEHRSMSEKVIIHTFDSCAVIVF
jgi:hypothetical protein